MVSDTTVLEVNGEDVTGYIAQGGYALELNDIDAPGAGRDMNGTMRRSLVTTKAKITVTCRVLSSEEMEFLVYALEGELADVNYYRPDYSVLAHGTFYCSKTALTLMRYTSRSANDEIFDNVKFDLIEV